MMQNATFPPNQRHRIEALESTFADLAEKYPSLIELLVSMSRARTERERDRIWQSIPERHHDDIRDLALEGWLSPGQLAETAEFVAAKGDEDATTYVQTLVSWRAPIAKRLGMEQVDAADIIAELGAGE